MLTPSLSLSPISDYYYFFVQDSKGRFLRTSVFIKSQSISYYNNSPSFLVLPMILLPPSKSFCIAFKPQCVYTLYIHTHTLQIGQNCWIIIRQNISIPYKSCEMQIHVLSRYCKYIFQQCYQTKYKTLKIFVPVLTLCPYFMSVSSPKI